MVRGRVLFVATVYSHLAAFHKPFIRMLQSEGYVVHTAASPSDGRKNELEDLGCECFDISFSRNPFYLASNAKAFLQLRDLLARNRYSLVHVHTPVAAFLLRLASTFQKQGPIIYTAHGFHFFRGAPLKNWVIYYSLEKLAKRWTDTLLVMNEEDYDLATRMGYKAQENLFLVNGVGVDLAFFDGQTGDTIRKELGLERNDVIVSCIAEMIPRKNHIEILKAWPEITEECPNAHLLLVGTGRERAKLERVVHNKEIANVHFLGFRSDVNNIISTSDVVILASKHEGLPRCIMEAMACGKPVIASNVRGSRDLVEHGVNGYLFQIGDKVAFVKYMRELIMDRDKREAMGRSGRRIIQEYSLDTVLSQVRHIYGRYIDLGHFARDWDENTAFEYKRETAK